MIGAAVVVLYVLPTVYLDMRLDYAASRYFSWKSYTERLEDCVYDGVSYKTPGSSFDVK